QRASNVAAIFVVHAKQSAEPMLFHHLACPLDAIFAEPVPIDPLLPVHAGDAEIRSHRVLPLVVKVLVPNCTLLPTQVAAQGGSPLPAVLSPCGTAPDALAGNRVMFLRPARFRNPKIAVHGVVAETILRVQVLHSEMPREILAGGWAKRKSISL